MKSEIVRSSLTVLPDSQLRPLLTISVVSHGHLPQIERLLEQLCRTAGVHIARVVLTHNLPPARPLSLKGDAPFELVQLTNATPQGFGANHNQAFARCETDFFCVLNPDIELSDPHIWQKLLVEAQKASVGCVYPVLVRRDGSPQDNERSAITPIALVRRHILRQPDRRVDWVSAAFWIVPAGVYRELGGFDASFYMYCEDTDFCLRLQLAGRRLARADVCAMHPASRNSRSQPKYMLWHLASLLRLWRSPVLYRYLALARSR